MLNKFSLQSVEKVTRFVSGFPKSRQLTMAELAKTYRSRFTIGWEIPQLVNDSNVNLRLLLPEGFPFSPPRIAVYPAPKILTWPHLEENGFLCLLPSEAAISTEEVEELAKELLIKAQLLVNDCLAGLGVEQFEDEFQSYWLLWHDNNASLMVMCRPEGPSRWVFAWHGLYRTVIADEESSLAGWLKNAHGESNNGKPTIQRIPLLWLPRPLRPAEYPNTVGKLLSLQIMTPEDQEIIRGALLSKEFRHQTILLGFNSQNGPVFAGIAISQEKDYPLHIKPLINGFRAKNGRIPVHVLFERYHAIPIKGASATRCDSAWIHGRDSNVHLPHLTDKRVVILGVGSVGSGVAELLAKAGVGELILVDPDLLASENTSRHTLGLKSLQRNKANELAEALSRRFPHLSISGRNKSWERLYAEQKNCFDSVDLVISTIGIWGVEGQLNALAKETAGFPPIIYGWTEPYAAAGHAVAIFGGKGCLRCLLDDSGRDLLPTTSWPKEGTLRATPLCGGSFQPYGAVELIHIQALVADLAMDVLLDSVKQIVHRTWIGKSNLIELNNGAWNTEWLAKHGDPGNGAQLVDVEFAIDPTCIICGDME